MSTSLHREHQNNSFAFLQHCSANVKITGIKLNLDSVLNSDRCCYKKTYIESFFFEHKVNLEQVLGVKS